MGKHNRSLSARDRASEGYRCDAGADMVTDDKRREPTDGVGRIPHGWTPRQWREHLEHLARLVAPYIPERAAELRRAAEFARSSG